MSVPGSKSKCFFVCSHLILGSVAGTIVTCNWLPLSLCHTANQHFLRTLASSLVTQAKCPGVDSQLFLFSLVSFSPALSQDIGFFFVPLCITGSSNEKLSLLPLSPTLSRSLSCSPSLPLYLPSSLPLSLPLLLPSQGWTFTAKLFE